MTQAISLTIQERLERETEHFEELYAAEAARGIQPLSDFDKVRYTNPSANTIFPREYFYHLLAPLKGKDTLEIAAGNGIDASICAHNGANVHAYDLSSESIKMVRQRADANGVLDRLQTQVTGHFTEAFANQTFDHIIGYAALHHIPYQGMAEQIYERLKPGGCAVFAEPVVNSKALRALRDLVPYEIFESTDDEVPWNDQTINEFAKPFDRKIQKDFQITSRLWPMFPNNWALTVALHKLDSYLKLVPGMRRFATVSVFALYRDR
ncbi:class I SAM-dependent methyltransferase [Poriferisphaera sp. WC338]|uniref:class I SAM-dependent methyltransferase n=1 Tax=Poriferisphaera sp. WC338 TaxID=3425129 RepID=UPI003D81947A